MKQPVLAQKSPYLVELMPGVYHWCACGRSRTQPYCDGSHEGTEWAPVRYEVAAPKRVWFCGCKQTLLPPLCDGSHSGL